MTFLSFAIIVICNNRVDKKKLSRNQNLIVHYSFKRSDSIIEFTHKRVRDLHNLSAYWYILVLVWYDLKHSYLSAVVLPSQKLHMKFTRTPQTSWNNASVTIMWCHQDDGKSRKGLIWRRHHAINALFQGLVKGPSISIF